MPTKTKHRIIIDTNLWISFLITSDYSELDSMLSDNSIILLFSQELIEEFVEVAQRPKFKKYFTTADLQELLIKIRTHAAFILVTSVVNFCRDLKDNFLLSLALDGKASHLITGDKDLLTLEKTGRTKILTMTEYLLEHRH